MSEEKKLNEVGIVIARVKEDLRYVEQIRTPNDVYIYNRAEGGKPDNIGNLDLSKVSEKVNVNIIDMEIDPGRSDGTYMYHIVTHYDCLNDYTVFLQGKPTDECSNIISILNNPFGLKHTRYVAINTGPSILPPRIEVTEEPIEFEYLADMFAFIDTRYSDPQLHGWSPYHHDPESNPFNKFSRPQGRPDWGWTFGASGEFVVHKSRILRHSKEHYQSLRDLIVNYIDPLPQHNPHRDKFGDHYGPGMMETIWQYVF